MIFRFLTLIIRYHLRQTLIFERKIQTMIKELTILLCAFFLLSCSNDKNNSEKEKNIQEKVEMPSVLDYFYPRDTTVYMYVYQNTRNPKDRYIERVIYKEMEGMDHFFISRYNSKMEPKYTKTYWVLDGNIELMKANIMVGRVSYESKIKNGFTFPGSPGYVANTTYDYPLNDSLIQVVEINRKFKNLDTILLEDKKAPVMVFQDSIRLSYVDVKNEQHQIIPAFMEVYFEKGIGKVMEKSDKQAYRLIMRTTADQFRQLQ